MLYEPLTETRSGGNPLNGGLGGGQTHSVNCVPASSTDGQTELLTQRDLNQQVDENIRFAQVEGLISPGMLCGNDIHDEGSEMPATSVKKSPVTPTAAQVEAPSARAIRGADAGAGIVVLI